MDIPSREKPDNRSLCVDGARVTPNSRCGIPLFSFHHRRCLFHLDSKVTKSFRVPWRKWSSCCCSRIICYQTFFDFDCQEFVDCPILAFRNLVATLWRVLATVFTEWKLAASSFCCCISLLGRRAGPQATGRVRLINGPLGTSRSVPRPRDGWLILMDWHPHTILFFCSSAEAL